MKERPRALDAPSESAGRGSRFRSQGRRSDSGPAKRELSRRVVERGAFEQQADREVSAQVSR